MAYPPSPDPNILQSGPSRQKTIEQIENKEAVRQHPGGMRRAPEVLFSAHWGRHPTL